MIIEQTMMSTPFQHLDNCGRDVEGFKFKIGASGYLRKGMIRNLMKLYSYSREQAIQEIERYRKELKD